MEEFHAAPTSIGLAIAIIALARFVRAEKPSLVPFLQAARNRAQELGVAKADLEFLETLIGSLRAPPDEHGGKPRSGGPR